MKISPGAPGQGSQVDPSQGRAGSFGIANLMPSQAAIDQLDGAAPNDHLTVDEGEGTFLNTKEWKYSTFYNRVHQAVGMYWNPGAVLRQRDPTGNIYGTRDRLTVLRVTLTQRGMIKAIQVEQGCGVAALDEEAIAAFHRAQPFPNPPPGLIDPDGFAHIELGFFLEFSMAPRLQFFGHPN
jgi:TonB family protein